MWRFLNLIFINVNCREWNTRCVDTNVITIPIRLGGLNLWTKMVVKYEKFTSEHEHTIKSGQRTSDT